MTLRSADFESAASASSAIRAYFPKDGALGNCPCGHCCNSAAHVDTNTEHGANIEPSW